MFAYNSLMSTKLNQLKYEPSTQLGINQTQDCVIFNFETSNLETGLKISFFITAMSIGYRHTSELKWSLFLSV